MQAALLNVPETQNQWNIWALHHRISHDAIRQALLAQKGIALTDYQLDPINFDDMKGFLQRNSQTHQEMDAALGAQGTDLLDVDLSDERQKVAWIRIHWQEHFTAEQALKL